MSLQPGVSPIFGSPAKGNPDGSQANGNGNGGNGKKGKKGKKSGDDIKSMGDAPGGAADPVEKVQEAAGEAPASEAGGKAPSPAGTTRALSDAPQDGASANAPQGDAPESAPALPDAAQKVDQVLGDATNGQHRRDPGIDAILDILSKAFPPQPPPEAARDAPKEAPSNGLSDAERGALEEKANNASKERDEAHSVSVYIRLLRR